MNIIDNRVNKPYNEDDFSYTVIYYVLDNGRIPVKEFLHSLEDKKLKAKVYMSISLLEKHGFVFTNSFSKHLGDGIFELRIKHSSNIVRCLYFYHHNRIIVLTNAFTKKTQKTPDNELKLAKKYRKDYLKRIGGIHIYDK